MKFSLSPNRSKVVKTLLYLLIITLSYMITTIRGLVLDSGFMTVNLMPFILAAIGFYEGPYMAGSLGVYAGLLASVSSSTAEGAEALILGLFAVFCGTAGVTLMRKIMPSVLFCGSALLAARGIISATYYRLFYGIPFFNVFGDHAVIILISVLPGILEYYLVAAVNRRFSEED